MVSDGRYFAIVVQLIAICSVSASCVAHTASASTVAFVNEQRRLDTKCHSRARSRPWFQPLGDCHETNSRKRINCVLRGSFVRYCQIDEQDAQKLSQDQALLVTTLVRRRAHARWRGDYSEADELLGQIQSLRVPDGFHIVVKDLPRRVGGTSNWELVPEPQQRFPVGLSVLQLAHAALGLAVASSHEKINDPYSKLKALVEAAKNRLEKHRHHLDPELTGRKAADAAFWFALAGVSDKLLFRLLTEVSLRELERFGARSSCRAKDIWQILERLTVAGVLNDGSMARALSLASNLLQLKTSKPESNVTAETQGLHFHSDRCLLTIWKFSTGERKQRSFLLSALKHWESHGGVGKTEDESNQSCSPPQADWNEVFTDPSLPLVVDIGCGMGVSLLGLAGCTERTSRVLMTESWSDCNFLGVDLNGLAVGYARGLSSRWGLCGRLHFLTAPADVLMEHVYDSYPGPVRLCLVQFPTPFRLQQPVDDKSDGNDGVRDIAHQSGNSRLPADATDGFMVTEELLGLISETLHNDGSESCGKLLLQSNCEDVAVWMRHTAESRGFRTLPSSKDFVDAGDLVPKRIPKRTEDWRAMGGAHADGPGWHSRPLLPRQGATETEVACVLNGTPMHRCVLVPKDISFECQD